MRLYSADTPGKTIQRPPTPEGSQIGGAKFCDPSGVTENLRMQSGGIGRVRPQPPATILDPCYGNRGQANCPKKVSSPGRSVQPAIRSFPLLPERPVYRNAEDGPHCRPGIPQGVTGLVFFGFRRRFVRKKARFLVQFLDFKFLGRKPGGFPRPALSSPHRLSLALRVSTPCASVSPNFPASFPQPFRAAHAF